MNQVAIKCEGIGKRGRIGQRQSHRALRDTLADAVTALFRRVHAARQGGNGDFVTVLARRTATS